MLSNDLVADRVYELIGPMPSEFNEIDALLDTLPSEIRAKLDLLIGSLYLDAIEQAFELGWRLRSDPTPLVFVKEQANG